MTGNVKGLRTGKGSPMQKKHGGQSLDQKKERTEKDEEFCKKFGLAGIDAPPPLHSNAVDMNGRKKYTLASASRSAPAPEQVSCSLSDGA